MTRDRLRRSALMVWATLGGLALIWVAWHVADMVRIIWLPVAFALGITMILNPLVDYFDDRGLPRPASTAIAYLIAAGIIALAVVLLVPVIDQQVSDFASQLPDLWDRIVEWLQSLSNRFGIDLGPVGTSESIRQWLQNPDNQSTIQDLLGGFGSGAGRVLTGVAHGVTAVILTPVLAFYMLVDSRKFQRSAEDLIPPSHRDEVVHVGSRLISALSSFVRGQLLVAFIVGVLSSIGLYLIDLPFWLIIGIIAGVLNMVPFVGPVVGGFLAVIVALLNGSVTQALWAAAVLTAVQQIDNHIITPLVQRTRVNLSPLIIVLALVAGGALAGLLGVLVAVPASAAIR
ncbi:MAG: AI-2E family transporter, partial [Acidimicrobiia bacterium]